MKSDTIAAVATPAGTGGIAVVRLSGDDALHIALAHLDVDALAPRHATYCRFDELDDVVAVYMPHGYTGEATVELSCHGSTYIQQAVLQALCDSGARLARPGEFTMRAFANGRLDLSQAEAVADLIEAATPAQHRLAVSQLRGGYAAELKALRQHLVDLTSLLELELDFSQEDVEFADRSELRRLIGTLHERVATLLDSFTTGNAIRRGIPVAIAGRPNAGKSSLLNALLDDDRAIVSPLPGTTRDTVEDTLTLNGLTFRFIDTAGLRHSDDPVESLGIERSRRAIAEAMIILHVVDATDAIQATVNDIPDGKTITVINKCDLVANAPQNRDSDNEIHVSARTGMGIDRLKEAMVTSTINMDTRDVMLSNVRHRDALRLVDQALANAERGLADNTPADLVAVDLRDALYHLGTITGEVTGDDILQNIFGRFCIGK